jgi:hypothetical protein
MSRLLSTGESWRNARSWPVTRKATCPTDLRHLCDARSRSSAQSYHETQESLSSCIRSGFVSG